MTEQLPIRKELRKQIKKECGKAALKEIARQNMQNTRRNTRNRLDTIELERICKANDTTELEELFKTIN